MTVEKPASIKYGRLRPELIEEHGLLSQALAIARRGVGRKCVPPPLTDRFHPQLIALVWPCKKPLPSGQNYLFMDNECYELFVRTDVDYDPANPWNVTRPDQVRLEKRKCLKRTTFGQILLKWAAEYGMAITLSTRDYGIVFLVDGPSARFLNPKLFCKLLLCRVLGVQPPSILSPYVQP